MFVALVVTAVCADNNNLEIGMLLFLSRKEEPNGGRNAAADLGPVNSSNRAIIVVVAVICW